MAEVTTATMHHNGENTMRLSVKLSLSQIERLLNVKLNPSDPSDREIAEALSKATNAHHERVYAARSLIARVDGDKLEAL